MTSPKKTNNSFVLSLSDVQISEIKKDVVWIKVKASSKMKNLISFALKSLHEKKGQILLTGSGIAIGTVNKILLCLLINNMFYIR